MSTNDSNTPRPNHDAWPAFVIPWDDGSQSPTDVSWLLHKPAGKHSFIQVKDGHLATGDGQRWRIWGQNVTLAVPMPPMDAAPKIARRMAKFGINCLRLHHIDHRWPEGLLMRHSSGTPAPIGRDLGVPNDGRGESTRTLDPEALARLDWFFQCCKTQGIYWDLNLNVSRIFTEADGVRQAELLGFAKAATYFDERLIFLQKEYAEQILTHVNPFTGLRYADDPALAIIELLNENSLIRAWISGRLKGAVELGETWGDIPSSYAEDLDQRWNALLRKRYGSPQTLRNAWNHDLQDGEDPHMGTVRRLTPEEFAAASDARFRDELRFYQSLEAAFFADMKRFLRDTIGAKQLIMGTSDCGREWSALPLLETHAKMDVMDKHAYWQGYWETPNLRRNKRPAREWYQDWRVTDTAMVDVPDRSLPAEFSRAKVAGRPLVIGEINEHFPGDYACECFPVSTAYGLLQDIDGFFWFGYAGGDWEGVFQFDPTLPQGMEVVMTQALTRFEWMCNDPMKMSLSAICALMFLRGDVQAARQIVQRYIPEHWVEQSCRATGPAPYWVEGLPGRLGLTHRTEIASFTANTLHPTTAEISLPTGATIVSDSGELTWTGGKDCGQLVIDTPRHQGFVMYQGRAQTTNLHIDLQTRFAAVQLTSLDDMPITRATTLWLVAAARVANTGMRWADDGRCSVTDRWGGPPTRIEPVQATLGFTGVLDAQEIVMRPLDGCGQPFGEYRVIPVKDGQASIELNAIPGTLWYILDVIRPYPLRLSSSYFSAPRR